MLFKYHGRPSGAFAADEYLAGLEAVRGYLYRRLYPLMSDSTLYVGLSCVSSWCVVSF
jgi:hypothetical protein